MMCAGTLSLLKNAGWDNHMATMTPGDKGSAVHTREEIASIRRLEAKTAAETTGGASYYCLGLEDLFVFFTMKNTCNHRRHKKNIHGLIPTTSTWMFAHNVYNLVSYLVFTLSNPEARD